MKEIRIQKGRREQKQHEEEKNHQNLRSKWQNSHDASTFEVLWYARWWRSEQEVIYVRDARSNIN